MNLETTRKIQNKIFYHDIEDAEGHEQNFLYFLGNHPTLYQEFIEPGFLTINEMNYINEHFFDYNVDARTFENEFKREMREYLPRYNMLKARELQDELFELYEDKYTRDIISNRATHLAQQGNRTSNGTTSNNNDIKQADRQLAMKSTGTNFEGIVSWGNGASNIMENKVTNSGTSNQTDNTSGISDGTDNGTTKETYKREGDPIEHIDRLWNYIVKPKAINWLTAQLSTAFILSY